MSASGKQNSPWQQEATFKSCDACFVIIEKDGIVREANPGLGQLLGYPAEELAGKKFSDLLVKPSSANPLITEVSLKYFFENPAFVYSTQLACRDGGGVKVRLLLRHSSETGSMLVIIVPDENLSPDLIKAAEPDDSFLENVFSTVGDGVYVTDEQGCIVKANPALAAMLGYSQSELIGKNSMDFIEQEKTDASVLPKLMRQLLSRGVVENYEALWRKKDGTPVQVELKVTLLKNRSGAMIGAVSAVRDITLRKLSEEALRESEQRFRVLANSAPDAIIYLDSRGKIIFWNLGAQKMYGYTYKEMLGKTPESIMPHDFFGRHQSYFMQPAADDFSDLTVESFGLHQNGMRFPVEISLSSGRAGSALFYCAIVRDITERKKNEKALRDSEERFRELAQSLPEGIIAVDSLGTIVFWNQGAQNLFGYTKEETLGKPSTLLIPQRYHQTETEGLNQLRQSGISNFQGRTGQSFARRSDGAEFAVEISAGPWQTRQGLYYVAIIRDITERLKAEQALRDSEQRFKELADALPQTVFELDLDGKLTFVNRTALDTFGHTQADIDKGMHALHMIVPEQRVTVRENIEKVLAGQSLGGQEYLALRKDGTTFPCIIHANPIIADGRPQGLRGLLIDITLRKELEEELNKSKRLASISTLAGGVAQDFNTILSIILGNINLAQHQVAPEDRISEHLAAAERATLRAKDLTDQLIAFAKGGTALKTAVSVEKLLREAADTALKGSNVTCRFSCPPDLQLVELDMAQMRQVFINLLINADHAMPEGGSIEISAENTTVGPGDNLPLPNGAYVKITISDQSIGILNEHLQQLFDPYFTSRQRGSGIGLATTYTIIKNHGGLITVESEFGRGTTFHIFLPAGIA
ncbi:MAG: PAS domain S-box protein [Deltaproteobacteria bacterium]|nr:PAS domain S-box protein [Deltaproteobacteria bacterium]